MLNERLADKLRREVANIDVRESEPMSAHTTFKIGGPADLFCLPDSADTLRELLLWARAEGEPVFALGGGSNLLVRDGGVRGVVVSTAKLTKIERIEDTWLEAECGVPLAKLASYARDCSLSGLEFAQGIPGSVGGGVYMNAGAYGGSLEQSVRETDALSADGKAVTVRGGEHAFGYRKSCFADGGTVLRTRIQLTRGDRDEIAAQMEDYRERRRSTQPLEYPSAGSAFKRPPGLFAGKLIQDSGLKGARVGGAQVSEKHAGFIINTGGATASDVLGLIEKIQIEVFRQFGVMLESEIRVIGEDEQIG